MWKSKIGEVVIVVAVVAVASFTPSLCWGDLPIALVRGKAVNDSNDLPGWCGLGPAPGADGSHYSGTVAYVIGRWEASPADPIKKVQLWVNGLLRFEQEWTSNYPSVYPGGISCDVAWKWVVFSTTQFAHASTLTLKAKMWTVSGQTAEATDSQHTAWNRAWVGANPENPYWVTRAGYARGFFLAASHMTTGVHTMATAGNILGTMPQFSCFHFTGHGTPYGFQDCLYRLGDPFSDAHYVDETENDPEISGAVAEKEGVYPSYNFVFLDTCDSGATPCLKNAFATTSFIGWDGLQDGTPPYQTFVQTFYNSLGNEGTVGSSAIDAYNASGLCHFAVWGGTYYVHRTYDPV